MTLQRGQTRWVDAGDDIIKVVLVEFIRHVTGGERWVVDDGGELNIMTVTTNVRVRADALKVMKSKAMLNRGVRTKAPAPRKKQVVHHVIDQKQVARLIHDCDKMTEAIDVVRLVHRTMDVLNKSKTQVAREFGTTAKSVNQWSSGMRILSSTLERVRRDAREFLEFYS